MTGASPEVIAHHQQLHRQHCPSDLPPEVFTCPCDSCFLIVCGRCEEALLLAVKPDSEPCEHALETLDEANP
jgi:hypothetical protein